MVELYKLYLFLSTMDINYLYILWKRIFFKLKKKLLFIIFIFPNFLIGHRCIWLPALDSRPFMLILKEILKFRHYSTKKTAKTSFNNSTFYHFKVNILVFFFLWFLSSRIRYYTPKIYTKALKPLRLTLYG